MATKLQTVSELTAQTMKRLTRSHEEWMSFLDTAAWLYKYPWHEQVMIYAQRPDATACASFDTWHLPRFRRWINSGAKGIALIDDSGERPALKYVYDVSDTNTRYNIPFKLWELREEHEAQVMDELTDHFGDIPEYAGLPFPDKLMGIIHIAVEDNAEDYLNALYKVTDGSYLDDLDKLNIEVSFKRALEASIGYMALTRLGFDAREYYEHEDFIPVFDFNTSQTLSQLGAATGDIAVMVLRQIERSVRSIEKQERDTLADSIMLIENEIDKENERSVSHERDNVQQKRGLYDTRYSDGRAADGTDRQIRDDAETLFEGKPQGNVQPSSDERQADRASLGDRRDGAGAGRPDNGADGENRGTDRGTESQRPNGMGGADEQHQAPGGGNRTDGADIQLKQNEAAEAESEKLPAFLSEEKIFGLLQKAFYTKGHSKDDIHSFFAAHISPDDRDAFIKDAFEQKVYNGIPVDGVMCGYQAQPEGLLMWEGNYLTRTSESRFSWALVEGFIEQLIERGEFGKVYQPQLFPSVPEQLSLIEQNTERQQLSLAISQQAIDEVLCSAGNNQNANLRICAYVQSEKSNAQLAGFLREEYGTGGFGVHTSDGMMVSAWWDADGIRVAQGRRARYNGAVITWEQAAKRTRELLELGRFMSASDLLRVNENERTELAEKLIFLDRDIEEGSLLDERLFQHGFPYDVARIAEQLDNPEQRRHFTDAVTALAERYARDRTVLRYPHRDVDRLIERLNGLDAHAAVFHADVPIILKDADYFITEDEIDRMLTGGGNVEYGNYDIYLYFTQPHSAAEKQAFLKKHYGIGGKSYMGYDEWHDGKGITFSRGRVMQPYEKLLIKWPQAVKRIDELIALDRYLTGAQKAHLPEYERQQAEREARLREERATREAMREAEQKMQDARQSAEYAFSLGDTVQIGGDSLTILGYDDETVTLTDPNYPLLSQDMPRDVFERRMRDSRANDHLIVSKDAASDKAHAEAPELQNDDNGTAPTAKQIAEKMEQLLAEGDEDAIPARASRDVFNEYSPLFISRVLHDEAYMNARSNSDEQNARTECDAAVERIMQSIIERSLDDNIELYNHYFDAGNGFKQRLCAYVFNKTYTEFMRSETLTPLWERQRGEASRVRIDIAPEQPQDERVNYRITDDTLGHGGAKTKYAMNIAAINALKTIEAEHRAATPEEQEVLSKYVGWGALANAFDESKADWANEYAELKSLLTEEEYASARASTLNAHYTSPTVIKAIYSAVERMGFRIGNVLEPACGIGNFFGLVPDSMADCKMYGVEFDPLTGRIAQQLYQKNYIAIEGFEQTNLPDSFFDLAIGNVPFGDYKLMDKRYDKNNFLIHDYFFAKTLDKIRPGGVVAFITSAGTMDKKNSAVRKYIAQRAELLGAVRLPNNAFLQNAGTQVVADILFLQKRDRPIEVEPEWLHLGKTDEGFTVNQYFIDNPDMVLGKLTSESTQYGKQECTVAPIAGAELFEQLRDAMANIHAEVTEYEHDDFEDVEQDSIPADPNVKNYSFAIVDGEIYYRENSRMNKQTVSLTAANRIRGMVEIRDSTRRLIELQLEEHSEFEIKREQAELNRLYDNYTKKYGYLNSRANEMAFSDDSAYPILCSLEVFDDDGVFKRKADMFSKRTIRQKTVITSVDTASEALAVSLSEKAKVDMPFMAQLTGKTEKELETELKGVIFRDFGSFDPAAMAWAFFDPAKYPFVTADEFLSGNVREKLEQAQGIFDALYGHTNNAELLETVKAHVSALEAVQPVPLTASEIEVNLGAVWLPPEVVQDFIYELLTPSRYAQSKIKVHYSNYTAKWNISSKSVDYENVKANAGYGTSRANAYKIIEDTLNLRDVRIFDTVTDVNGNEIRVLNKDETIIAQQKQQAIKDAFAEWIWSDPNRRERLVGMYNKTFNSTRPREYDGSHLRFPGMNPEITLRPHQVNAVARALYGGNTLLAHCVGAGKTYTMAAIAMKAKQLGMCQKSLIAVPSHLTGQIASEFLQLYPSANILMASKKDFETRNRKRFCARIATGDYDAVVIGHSQFERIPMSVEGQKQLLQEQLNEIILGIADAKAANEERFTIKQMEKTRATYTAKLKKLNAEERKDSVVTFEELGVDKLFVDEAHNFKNLFLVTKMRNVAGVSQTEAQKSTDLYNKCRYLDRQTDSKGVVFATGTPISNSMTEMFTMQRYLQLSALIRQNMQHFDAWASNYGQTVTAIELAPEGNGFRAKTRFARFHNLPELITMFKEIADIQTADMLKLPVPEVVYTNIALAPSEMQKDIVESLGERADAVRNGDVDPTEDNMLKITNDGRKLALDQRLIDPLLPDSEQSKTSACANKVYEIWERTQADRLTQLVFCDLSTPKEIKMKQNEAGEFEMGGFQNVYDDVRQKLMAKGVPENEIAFIHDAKTDTAKAELFAKVRSGQVRVLIGSTFKMGAGTNVQTKLAALHHLDVPWRPSDIEQREGRMIRQGNQNKTVEVFRYVTEGTFDAYMWGIIENKQRFISQIMTGKSPVRTCEDIDETTLSFAEVKALASGNPLIMEKTELESDIAKLRLIKSRYLTQKYALEDKLLKYLPQQVLLTKERIAGYEQDAALYSQHRGVEFGGMELQGVLFDDKKAAGTELIAICKATSSPQAKEIGRYMGFPLWLAFNTFEQKFELTVKGALSHTIELGGDVFGNIQRLDNVLEGFPARIASAKSALDELAQQIKETKAEVEKPFTQEFELKQKSERLAALDALLNMDKRENDTLDAMPEQEEEKERIRDDYER